jgi:acetyltransferase-like isoleucine patch superfamily enzyme
MASSARIEHGRYTDVEYLQYRSPAWVRRARAVCGVLVRPFVWTLAWICRRSDVLFRTVSELLSLIPYAVGIVVRAEFYRFALARCGDNVVIEFGVVFVYRDVSIGDHVTIGRYCIVHHCDFGDYVLVGEHSVFLSGSHQHNVDRVDVPIALQRGRKKRIAVGSDCWIGAHAVVMEDVADGAVVGAGSVVTRPVPASTIAAGNPARLLRRRGSPPPPAGPVPEAAMSNGDGR